MYKIIVIDCELMSVVENSTFESLTDAYTDLAMRNDNSYHHIMHTMQADEWIATFTNAKQVILKVASGEHVENDSVKFSSILILSEV